MQEIKLDNSPADINWVLSTMFFPNDTRLREQHFTVHEIRIQNLELQDEFKIMLDVKTINLLLNAPSIDEFNQKKIEATKRAVIAGDVLSMIYLMHRFKDADPAFARPSINKAIAFSSEFGLMRNYGDGTKMHYSPKKIRDCWDEFKPVAHLWAAQRISQNPDYEINKGTNFESMEALNKFLGVAQGIFQFGCTFIPQAAKPQLPILDRQSSWVIPNSIDPLRLITDLIPDRLLEYAKQYNSKS